MTSAKQLYRRFLPFYVANFFIGFVFWYAIEKLFMKSIGFNDATIGIVLSLTGVSMLIAGIPSGILADKWSRKGVLMIACVFLALTGLIGGSSHSPGLYAVAAITWGFFYALYNGINSTIVYDTLLEETGETKEFSRYFGRVQIYDSVALISGSLLSGVLLRFLPMRGLYLASIPAALLAIISLAFFREPKLHEQHNVSFGQKFNEVVTFTRQKGTVAWIILSLFIIVILQRLLFDFYQLWLIALLVPAIYFGPISAAMQSSIGLGGVVALRLHGNRRRLRILLVAVVVAALCITLRFSVLPIACLIFLQVAAFTLYVVMSKYMHDELESHIRASGSSVVGTLGEVGFLFFAPLVGYVSSKSSPFVAGWILAALAVAMVLAVNKVVNGKTLKRPEPGSLVEAEQYQK